MRWEATKIGWEPGLKGRGSGKFKPPCPPSPPSKVLEAESSDPCVPPLSPPKKHPR